MSGESLAGGVVMGFVGVPSVGGWIMGGKGPTLRGLEGGPVGGVSVGRFGGVLSVWGFWGTL